MNTTVAKVISYIFQPLIMPLLTVLLAFNIDPYLTHNFSSSGKMAVYSVLGLNTFLVPTLLIIYLKKLKIISSLDVENRRERFIPFGITLVLYITTYILLRRSTLPDLLYSMVAGAILAMIIAFIITMFWKISIHMTGVGGLIGAMCALFDLHQFFLVGILTGLLLLAGFIGSARMALKVHSLAQVIMGTILGFLSQYLSIRYGFYL